MTSVFSITCAGMQLMSSSYSFSRAAMRLLGLCSFTMPAASCAMYLSPSVWGIGADALSSRGESSREVTWQDSSMRRARRRLRFDARAMLMANSSASVMFSLRETVFRTAHI